MKDLQVSARMSGSTYRGLGLTIISSYNASVNIYAGVYILA